MRRFCLVTVDCPRGMWRRNRLVSGDEDNENEHKSKAGGQPLRASRERTCHPHRRDRCPATLGLPHDSTRQAVAVRLRQQTQGRTQRLHPDLALRGLRCRTGHFQIDLARGATAGLDPHPTVFIIDIDYGSHRQRL